MSLFKFIKRKGVEWYCILTLVTLFAVSESITEGNSKLTEISLIKLPTKSNKGLASIVSSLCRFWLMSMTRVKLSCQQKLFILDKK